MVNLDNLDDFFGISKDKINQAKNKQVNKNRKSLKEPNKQGITNIRIATRKSRLALWQAHFIGDLIQHYDSSINIIYVPLSTKGDEVLDKYLSEIGGKDLFVKTLEEALLEDRADIAVHSLKDVGSRLDDDFYLAMFSDREDPRDALLSKKYDKIKDLSRQSVIGTGSPRRVAQLRAMGFKYTKLLRGNIATRINKLQVSLSKSQNNINYDAIIIAYAALLRLNLKSLADDVFSIEDMLPAPGQGVMAVECLARRADLRNFLADLDNKKVRCEVTAERYITASLDGDCHSPIGMYAQLIDNKGDFSMNIKAMIASPKTGEMIKYDRTFAYDHKEEDNHLELDKIVDSLVKRGARKLLQDQ